MKQRFPLAAIATLSCLLSLPPTAFANTAATPSAHTSNKVHTTSQQTDNPSGKPSGKHPAPSHGKTATASKDHRDHGDHKAAASGHHAKHSPAPSGEVRHYEALPEVRDFIDGLVQRHGFQRDELIALFAKARFQPAVIKAILPPSSPRQKSWQAYRARFVEPTRIRAGLRFWDDYADALQQAEQRYGVPADIIASIIGVETIYGRNTGNFETFSALTTLAFDYPPRADLFRRELEALLLLARDEQRSPLSYQGSYAGALGLPQFLPSSLRNWAVDFNGDHHIDLTNPVDAIGSVGRFLAEHGWEKDGPIVVPAQVQEGPGSDSLIAEGISPKRLPDELRAFGVTAGNVPQQPVALIDLVTPDAATEYRLGYRNFYVITRYNRSSFYASSVNDLAQALKAARLDR